jgi:DNA-binding CsgD family transcriptional regulator
VARGVRSGRFVSTPRPSPPPEEFLARFAPQRLNVSIAGRIPECFQSTLWSTARSFQRRGSRHVVLREATHPVLTSREMQVVRMVMNRQATKSIAYDLGITPSTARVLLSRALMKLGLSSRKELVPSETGELERSEGPPQDHGPGIEPRKG